MLLRDWCVYCYIPSIYHELRVSEHFCTRMRLYHELRVSEHSCTRMRLYHELRVSEHSCTRMRLYHESRYQSTPASDDIQITIPFRFTPASEHVHVTIPSRHALAHLGTHRVYITNWDYQSILASRTMYHNVPSNIHTQFYHTQWAYCLYYCPILTYQ